MESIASKLCLKCGIEHPATSEFYHRRTQAKDGLAPYCKKCIAVAAQASKEKNPDQLKARHARYRAKNPDRIKTQRQEFYARHLGVRRGYHLKWYQGNLEQNRQAARERNRGRALYKRAHARARRAKIKEAAPIPQEMLERKLLSQGGKCYWCQSPLAGGHHIDHIFPLSRGGEHVLGNLCFSCPACNREKCAKSPQEFIGRLF